MSVKKEYKGALVCPNGHMYNANKYGDTCPNCGAKQQDKEKTPEEYEEELTLQNDDFTCGWLVCLEGINKGRDYKIKSGKNFIGSDPNMDIVIKGNRFVEPKNHAVIIYDPVSRMTCLHPGTSRGMVYITDKAIYEPTELSSFDKIEIGNDIFMFTNLCGADFDWSDLKNDV